MSLNFIRVGLYLGMGALCHLAFYNATFDFSNAWTWVWLLLWPVMFAIVIGLIVLVIGGIILLWEKVRP